VALRIFAAHILEQGDKPMAIELELTCLASGLQFPEGPVALADGTLLLTEIQRGTLTRITPQGEVQVVAELAAAPMAWPSAPMARPM
jgi:gluconolactonase